MNNHYVVARIPTETGPKLTFGKVVANAASTFDIRVERNCHIKATTETVARSNLVLDLGPTPMPGKVYGFDTTSLFYRGMDHYYFGPIQWMYKPKKAVGEALVKALDRAATILTKRGFKDAPGNTLWEVHPKEAAGKWAGWYKMSKNPERAPDLLAIKPESLLAQDSLLYVILHEYAHLIHLRGATGVKLNARWIRLFNTSIRQTTITKEKSAALYERLIGGQEKPSELKGQLEEDDKLAYTWILRVIKADHSISVSELDCLFEAEEFDELKSIWPKRTLNKRELAPIVSEYATTNVKELIAESIAFHLMGKKLPQGIANLVEKTLSVAKDQL
jgi:hypothetical protein